MGWGTAIALGANVIGGLMGRKANNQAAGAISGAANQANQFASQQYQPYTALGAGAAGNLSALMGGDLSKFYASPDYQAALSGGVTALDKSAAAKGGLWSGGHGADLQTLGQQTAAQYLGNYRNALLGQSQLGVGAAGNLSNLYGQNLMNAAGAQYNRIQGNAGINNQLLGDFAGAFGSYMGGRPAQSGWGFSPVPVAPINTSIIPSTPFG